MITCTSVAIPLIVCSIELVFVPFSPSNIELEPGSDDKNPTLVFMLINEIHGLVIPCMATCERVQ